MLRKLVLALGIVSLAGAALLLFKGAYPPAAWLTVNGLVMTLGVIYERKHYKTLDDAAPGPGWQATGERFVDPGSGQLVEVYCEAGKGERRYVKVRG